MVSAIRCFLFGLGVVVGLLGVSFFSDQSGNYTARVETGEMMLYVSSFRSEIESMALKQKALTHLHVNFDPAALKKAGISYIHMSDAGEFVVNGGRHGQIFVLTPTLAGDKVVWRCIGGPDKDMPVMCRTGEVIGGGS